MVLEQKEMLVEMKQKAVVIIDVTLNNTLQQLVISEIQPGEQQVGQHHDFHPKLDTTASLDAFCAKHQLSSDKRRRLEQVVDQQIEKYYQKINAKKTSRSLNKKRPIPAGGQGGDLLSQIDEQTDYSSSQY